MQKNKTLLVGFLSIMVAISGLGLTFAPTVDAGASQTITNVSIIEGTTSTRISWKTSDVSKTQLFYSTDKDYTTEVSSEYLRRDHLITLQALESGTTYYFKIIATDEAGAKQKVYEDSFTTLGDKQQLTVYQNYFSLLFDNYWENINGINPTSISDIDGLSFNEAGFVNTAMSVNRPDSYLEYSCENVFNPGFGAVTAWVSFDTFNKSAVIWQTDDSRYVLYYEVGGKGSGFDKRIVARAGGNEDGEYPEVAYVIDPAGSVTNQWGTGEWHFIAMAWEGKINGTLRLYIDGRQVGETTYTDGSGCSTFRIGNNYRDDTMFFSIGQIDELKLHQWAMSDYYVYQNYLSYASNSKFGVKGTAEAQVAGASIRKFSYGDLIRTPDKKVYIITRDNQKLYVADLSALSRYGTHSVIEASYDEADQYTTSGTFYAWSLYPDGTLLKGSDATIFWVWDGDKHPIASEAVFHKYGNQWNEVINVSDIELRTYPTGYTYF